MSLRQQDKRVILIGLMVGLIVSAGVASNSGTPVLAFVMSAVLVVADWPGVGGNSPLGTGAWPVRRASHVPRDFIRAIVR